MDSYDPRNPSINYSYNYFKLSNNTLYYLERYLQNGELVLWVDSYCIGSIARTCGKLFSQSKIMNGIVNVRTVGNVSIGHIVIVNNNALHFVSESDTEFRIDTRIIIYK